MKHLIFAFALLVHCLACAAPRLKGVTDKDPLSYAVGEDIVFTVSLEGAESFPDGVSATWRRSGDDGVEEKGTWNGRDLVVAGGSQGSLQAMWCAAFVPGVTEAQIFIPWLCDIGGTTDGRNHGDWFPEWAPGLDYFDQVNVAKRIPETCRVAISRIGLGDYIAPPCGAAMMYRSLKCPKSAVWVQGSTHGYVPPMPQKIVW